MQIWDPTCIGNLPGFGSHGTVRDFHECFGKSLYGCNLLLSIQDFIPLLPRDIRFSTNEGVYPLVYSEYVEGSWSSRMLMCMCVYGESLLTSGERNIQKKTLNPLFWHNPVGCFITTIIIINSNRILCTTNEVHEDSNSTDYVVGGSWLSLLKYWTARFNGYDDRLAWLLSEYGKPSQDSLQTCK